MNPSAKRKRQGEASNTSDDSDDDGRHVRSRLSWTLPLRPAPEPQSQDNHPVSRTGKLTHDKYVRRQMNVRLREYHQLTSPLLERTCRLTLK